MIIEREESEAIAAYYHEIGELLELGAELASRRWKPGNRAQTFRREHILNRFNVALKATRANEASTMNLLLSYQNVPDDGVLKMSSQVFN